MDLKEIFSSKLKQERSSVEEFGLETLHSQTGILKMLQNTGLTGLTTSKSKWLSMEFGWI
jgi:hypothetical protein